MNTVFPLVMTDDVAGAVRFYVDVFGFESTVDLGWYAQLAHRDNAAQQIALIDRTHDSLPSAVSARPGGMLITLECDDADAYYERVRAADRPIHVALRDEEWGQRHFITEDPAGVLVDVVQPIAPSEAFLKRHGLAAG